MWRQVNIKPDGLSQFNSLKRPRTKFLELDSSAANSKFKVEHDEEQLNHTKNEIMSTYSEIPGKTQMSGEIATQLLGDTTSTGESSLNDEKTLKRELQLEDRIQENNKEIEKLKRQCENLERKNGEKTKEIQRLKARIKELEKEVESLKSQLEQVNLKMQKFEENQPVLNLGSMYDKMQKNFYQIVFHPYDFSENKDIYRVVNIDEDIENGWYNLFSEEKKNDAKGRWENLKKKLGWRHFHLDEIVDLKKDRRLPAHPPITIDMKENLRDDAQALRKNNMLDPYRYNATLNLIEMWHKSEKLCLELQDKR